MIYPQEFQASQKDALRHATQFFAGEVWSITPGTVPSLLDALLNQEDLGQGHFPLLADARRGIYQTTLQWLRDQGRISEEWQQGQVLPYLPEFQNMLLETAQKTSNGSEFETTKALLQQYQIPELQALQAAAGPLSHKDWHQFTDQDQGLESRY